MHNDFWPIRLQLFADGDGAAGGDTGNAPDAGALTGGENAGGAATPAEKTPFDELLKDPYYKSAYEKKMQTVINGRFRAAKAAEEKLAAWKPVQEALGKLYNIQPNEAGEYDMAALGQKVLDNDALYEQEAMERGCSTQTVKELHAMQRRAEAAEAKEQAYLQQEQRNQEFQRIVQQAEAAKQIYPGLNLEVEMQNPAFGRLVAAGVPVKTAYEVAHKDEILGGAMQYAVAQTKQQVANAVAAGSTHPTEGAAGSPNAAAHTMDVRKLTKEQREQIRAAVMRGERVVL